MIVIFWLILILTVGLHSRWTV